MGYRKSDVQTHSEMGRSAHPAVNIKCHLWESGERGSWPTDLLRSVADEFGHDPEAFVSWWRELAEEHEEAFGRMIDTYSSLSAEDSFEMLREDASEVFGISGSRNPYDGRWEALELWQEGRSGGWLVVNGLPELDSWDAVALSKWRKFERYVLAARDAHPESVAALVVINAYESHLDRIAERERFERVGKWERAFAGSALAGYAAAFNGSENAA